MMHRHSDQPDDHLGDQSPCNQDSLGAAYWCHSFQPWQEAIWAFRFFILLKGWSQDLHPSTRQKKGPFLAGFWLQVVTCSHWLLDPKPFCTKRIKTSSGAGCSGPWVTLVCCLNPCFVAYSWPHPSQMNLDPWMQPFWWAFNMRQLSNNLEQLPQGNCSPLWTSICSLNW